MSEADNCTLEGENLKIIFEQVIDHSEHESIRVLYEYSKSLRNSQGISAIPLNKVYRFSLYVMFNTLYKDLATKEIAKIEGIPERTAFRYRKEFYDFKRKHKDLFNRSTIETGINGK